MITDTHNNKLPEPTKSELEILQTLWQAGPSTVRTVNELLNEQQREVNYHSTLKLMQIMLDKGLLLREIVDRSHIYRPAAGRESTQAQVIRSVANLAFGGSPAQLAMQALGNADTTPEELERIKQLIREIEDRQKQQS
jgi:BlaI family transcriptional regulator, penicillinase repressor